MYGLVQTVSTLKYCSTFEIVFVHFREDFENKFQLCLVSTYTTKAESVYANVCVCKMIMHKNQYFALHPSLLKVLSLFTTPPPLFLRQAPREYLTISAQIQMLCLSPDLEITIFME